MLPLILILLVQGLSAAEFSDLGSHITINWFDGQVSGQLDGSQTKSVNGQVPTFYICGPYNNIATSLYCSASYETQEKTSVTATSYFSGYSEGTAIHRYQRDGSYSCWEFPNPIPDFDKYNKGIATGKTNWSVTYTCPVLDEQALIIKVVIGLVVVIVLGAIAFKLYQNKKAEELHRNQYHSGGSFSDNFGVGGPSYGSGNPGYGAAGNPAYGVNPVYGGNPAVSGADNAGNGQYGRPL